MESFSFHDYFLTPNRPARPPKKFAMFIFGFRVTWFCFFDASKKFPNKNSPRFKWWLKK